MTAYSPALPTKCTIKNCPNTVRYTTKQVCARCYKAWRLSGKKPANAADLAICKRVDWSADVFWSLINKNGPTVRLELGPCWIWCGDVNSNGYGRCGWKKERTAHRTSALIYGIIEPQSKLFVLHKCDNKPCCNPEHLYAGTDSDNKRDHHARQFVDYVNNAMIKVRLKLNYEKAIEIRLRRAESSLLLAAEYGVTPRQIERIWFNEVWKPSRHERRA